MQIPASRINGLACTCATITDDDQLKGWTVVRSDLPWESLQEIHAREEIRQISNILFELLDGAPDRPTR